jgi:hypothetical protein
MRGVLISILIPSLPREPFSAVVNTEWTRQLADGTTITLKNHRAIARDHDGRIFQERRLLVPDDGKHTSEITQIEISDPIAHEQYICVPQDRVCQVEPFTPDPFIPPQTARTASPRPPGAPVLEDLGTQSISGLETIGIQETATIETGAVGNNNPIQINREYWYSPLLGVNLISKVQDPQVGNQNFELSGIILGEPDAMLFKVPSDSKVIDLRKPPRVLTPIPNPE